MLSILSGPLCSIILCIFAGIALRYALWFGRDDGNSLTNTQRDQLDGVQGKLQSLEQQLATTQGAKEALHADYRQLCDEFDRYRQDATTRDSEARVKLAKVSETEARIEELQGQLAAAREAEQQLEAQLEVAEQSASESATQVQQQLAKTTNELARTADELSDAQNELKSLQRCNDDLQEQIGKARKQAIAADENYQRMSSDLEATNAEHEQRIASLIDELQRSKEEKEAVEARCARLETELQNTSHRESELGEHVATLSADARFVEDLRHQLTGLQAAFTQRTEDMQSMTAERDAIGEQVSEMAVRLDTAHTELQSAQQEIGRLQQELAATQQESESLIEERTNLATSLAAIQASSSEQLSTTQQLVMGLQAELANSHSELEQLGEENNALIKEITSLRTRSKEELKVAYDRVQELEHGLETQAETIRADVNAQIAAKENELHGQLRLHEANAASRLGAIEAERTELREQLEREQAMRAQAISDEVVQRTEALRAESDEQLTRMSQQLDSVNEQLRSLQTEKDEVLNGLHRERDLRIAMEARVEEISTQNQELQSASESATGRVSHFERRMAGLLEELDDAEKRLAVRDAAVGELRVENRELLAKLEREKQERAVLERSVNIHAETLEKLRADSESLETLLERQARVQSSLQQHATMLRSAADPESTFDMHDDQEAAMPYQDSGVSLEAESKHDAVGVYSLHSGAADPGITRIDPILGNVYATPPTSRDDLKLISGIGETLERKLNRLGIFQYEQIMRWDSHAINEFSNILAFKDRIERERWVEQAAELYRKQYGIDRAA